MQMGDRCTTVTGQMEKEDCLSEALRETSRLSIFDDRAETVGRTELCSALGSCYYVTMARPGWGRRMGLALIREAQKKS